MNLLGILNWKTLRMRWGNTSSGLQNQRQNSGKGVSGIAVPVSGVDYQVKQNKLARYTRSRK